MLARFLLPQFSKTGCWVRISVGDVSEKIFQFAPVGFSGKSGGADEDPILDQADVFEQNEKAAHSDSLSQFDKNDYSG